MLKTGTKTILIVFIIAAVILLIVGGYFAYKHFELKIALSKMDIQDKESVIKVLSLCKDDSDALDDIATAYFDANDTTHGIAVAMHNLIKNNSAVCKALLYDYYKSAGADNSFLLQLESVPKADIEFDTLTEWDGVEYGGTDGVYCSDFGGYINYKLSSIRARYMTATDGGVYVLDIADNCKKLILRDCYTVQTLADDAIDFKD